MEDVKGSAPRWSLLLWVQLAAVVGVLEHREKILAILKRELGPALLEGLEAYAATLPGDP